MATFKICIRKQRRDGLFPVYIRITHNRKTGYIKTEKIVDTSCLKKGQLKDPTLLSYFSNLIKLYSERLNAVEIMTWDVHEVVAYLQNIEIFSSLSSSNT